MSVEVRLFNLVRGPPGNHRLWYGVVYEYVLIGPDGLPSYGGFEMPSPPGQQHQEDEESTAGAERDALPNGSDPPDSHIDRAVRESGELLRRGRAGAAQSRRRGPRGVGGRDVVRKGRAAGAGHASVPHGREGDTPEVER